MPTMTTPYRDDTESLEARHAALAEELSSVQEKTRALDELKASEARLAREVADVAKKLEGRARRTLPLLDTVKIATPCTASWDAMIGDDRARFCTHCQKDVFNLSAIPRDEAEAFIRTRTAEVCVRLYKRADGTVLTSDCPVGVTRKRRLRAVVAVVGGGLLVGGALFTMWSRQKREPEVRMGEMVEVRTTEVTPVHVAPPPEPVSTSTSVEPVGPRRSTQMMGRMRMPDRPIPPATPKTPVKQAPKPGGSR